MHNINTLRTMRASRNLGHHRGTRTLIYDNVPAEELPPPTRKSNQGNSNQGNSNPGNNARNTVSRPPPTSRNNNHPKGYNSPPATATNKKLNNQKLNVHNIVTLKSDAAPTHGLHNEGLQPGVYYVVVATKALNNKGNVGIVPINKCFEGSKIPSCQMDTLRNYWPKREAERMKSIDRNRLQVVSKSNSTPLKLNNITIEGTWGQVKPEYKDKTLRAELIRRALHGQNKLNNESSNRAKTRHLNYIWTAMGRTGREETWLNDLLKEVHKARMQSNSKNKPVKPISNTVPNQKNEKNAASNLARKPTIRSRIKQHLAGSRRRNNIKYVKPNYDESLMQAEIQRLQKKQQYLLDQIKNRPDIWLGAGFKDYKGFVNHLSSTKVNPFLKEAMVRQGDKKKQSGRILGRRTTSVRV